MLSVGFAAPAAMSTVQALAVLASTHLDASAYYDVAGD